MRILLVASPRSGVGTTTLALNLAALVARQGESVLVIDADPTQVARSACGCSHAAAPHRRLGDAPAWTTPHGFTLTTPFPDDLAADHDLEISLRAILEDADGCYDLVVIDSPAGETDPVLLQLAREMVIVAPAERSAFKAMPGYLDAIRAARKAGAAVGVRGILLTVPAGSHLTEAVESTLREKFRGLLPQTIPHDPALVTPQVVAESSPVAGQYQSLARTLKLTRPALVPALAQATRPEREADNEEVGIFHAPRPPLVDTPPLSGRTETFYPDRRPRPGKGPALRLEPAAPGKRKPLTKLELALLTASGCTAAAAALWFLLG